MKHVPAPPPAPSTGYVRALAPWVGLSVVVVVVVAATTAWASSLNKPEEPRLPSSAASVPVTATSAPEIRPELSATTAPGATSRQPAKKPTTKQQPTKPSLAGPAPTTAPAPVSPPKAAPTTKTQTAAPTTSKRPLLFSSGDEPPAPTGSAPTGNQPTAR